MASAVLVKCTNNNKILALKCIKCKDGELVKCIKYMVVAVTVVAEPVEVTKVILVVGKVEEIPVFLLEKWKFVGKLR